MNVLDSTASFFSCIAAVAAVVVALYVNYQSNSPHLVAYLEHDRDLSCVWFIVRNIGSGVASNVQIHNFDYKLVDSQLKPKVKKGFVGCGIPMLVPDAFRNTVIQAGETMKTHEDDRCAITLTYEKKRFLVGRKTVSEDFVLEYSSFISALYLQSIAKKAAEGVEENKKGLDYITKELHEISLAICRLADNTDDNDR